MKVLLALAALCCFASAATLRPFKPELMQEPASEGRAVLIQFYSPSCSVCAQQQRALEHIAQDPPGWEPALLQAEFDRDLELRRRYRVSKVSTLLLIQEDSEIGRTVGLETEEEIRAFILAAESKTRGVPAPRAARPFRPRR